MFCTKRPKAAGVTFAISMLERVIEERARGDASAAGALRAALEAICPEGLNFVPVSDGKLLCACSVEIGSGKKAVKIGMAGIVPPARARELDLDAGAFLA